MKLALSLLLLIALLALSQGMRMKQDVEQIEEAEQQELSTAYFESGTPDPSITWGMLTRVFGVNDNLNTCFDDVNQCVEENSTLPNEYQSWNGNFHILS